MCHCETGERHQHHGQRGDCHCDDESDRQTSCQCGCSGGGGGCGPGGGQNACDCDGGHGGCGCEGARGGFRRRFRSKAEVIAELESYLTELKAEAQAVEEHLKELRS